LNICFIHLVFLVPKYQRVGSVLIKSSERNGLQVGPSKRRPHQRFLNRVSLWELSSATILIDRKAVRLPSLNPLPPPTIQFSFSHRDRSSFFSHFSDMSQPSSFSSTSSFQGLFNAALQDYENQTGTKLAEHPLSKKLEACDSVDSIIAIFQEQAQIFRKFKGDDGKIMKSIKSSVNILYTLSNSTLLGEGIGLVHPKPFIGVPCSYLSFYRLSRLRMQSSPASLSYSPYVPLSDTISVYQ
jgi:hypothetical protein